MHAWSELLTFYDKEFGKSVVDKWLRSLKIVHYDACNLYLEAENSFQLVWFSEHIRKRLKKEFINNNRHPIKVHLALKNTPRIRKKIQSVVKEAPKFQEILSPYCTLEHFIFSESNALVQKVVEEVFLQRLLPDPLPLSYNPIYIHGPHSSGKTHLLMAIAHQFNQRGFKAIYTTGKKFVDDVIQAIRSAHMHEFRRFYRNCDALLIDNIGAISGKFACQEELFHTFNALHLDGKPIIVTSQMHTGGLEEIEPRLISRLEWGIALALAPLHRIHWPQLLEVRAEQYGFALTRHVIEFLLNRFNRSSQSLLNAFEALVMRAKLRNSGSELDELSLNQIRMEELLQDLLTKEKTDQLTLNSILEAVEACTKIPSENILGSNRSQEHVNARKIAMYLCRKHLALPYKQIGKHFTRDHSTVMSNIRQVEKKIESRDMQTIDTIEIVEQLLNKQLA